MPGRQRSTSRPQPGCATNARSLSSLDLSMERVDRGELEARQKHMLASELGLLDEMS
jgi:hypothetical protein